jgi:hypothetical protein
MSSIIGRLDYPRDWPPQFPSDLKRIQSAVYDSRGVKLIEEESQSFWEEVSDPDGWTTPGYNAEIVSAYDRIAG